MIEGKTLQRMTLEVGLRLRRRNPSFEQNLDLLFRDCRIPQGDLERLMVIERRSHTSYASSVMLFHAIQGRTRKKSNNGELGLNVGKCPRLGSFERSLVEQPQSPIQPHTTLH